ncbi:MAG: hypothetical protein IPG84_10690 [Betaproteobacteria bacterium]|nr:hypothetical protein [Betaproteobacteria bacterium]
MRLGWMGVLALMIALGGGHGAAAQPQASASRAPKPVTVTLVHLNDVYEVLPVEGGKSGGLARVATAIQQLKKTRSPLLTTLGGDYLSPSALGTAIVDGKPIAGRHMVDVLNATGVDWATFGNHEFDVSEARSSPTSRRRSSGSSPRTSPTAAASRSPAFRRRRSSRSRPRDGP